MATGKRSATKLQASSLDAWIVSTSKRSTVEDTPTLEENMQGTILESSESDEEQCDEDSHPSGSLSIFSEPSRSICSGSLSSICSDSLCSEDSNSVGSVASQIPCDSICCSDDKKPFQPRDDILKSMAKSGRNIVSSWFKHYPWLTVCTTKKKVYCTYCKFANKRGLITFSKNANPAFTVDGFNNWKKAKSKFNSHDASLTHKEAKMKWLSLQKPSLPEQIHTQTMRLQNSRRNALLKQLSFLRYLLRQGLAVRGHTEVEGNLIQLLILARDSADNDVREWLKDNKYMSHDIVNEQITIMGHAILRTLLKNIKTSKWFSVIVDEATDVVNREQMNLSIRWVNDEYDISEDPVGLVCLPNTTADTLTKVLKDLLLRCSLPLSLCRGQAYDGASNMQGKRKGLATQIKRDNPAALSVHCFAHCLNLCLQDAGRQITLLRNALDLVKEISKLIRFSPKRSHLFNTKLLQTEQTGVSIKPLCPTRWTARTASINAVLLDYSILMDLMDEIHRTTHDEYGLKAGGILTALEKFDTLFGLKLAYLLFSIAEEVSKCLQAKDTSLQDGLSAVNLASNFYERQRSFEAFNLFYDGVIRVAENLEIGQPLLPRYRRPPARLDSGSRPHCFATPKEYYRHLYLQACDLLQNELKERFDQKENLAPVLALESLLIKAGNGENYEDVLQAVEDSCYANDFNITALRRQLPLLVDVVKQLKPTVRKVTSIRTVCQAMNTNNTYKVMLSEVHVLLCLYLTVPVTSSTCERTFSVLKRLLTYLRSTMTEKRLNNCLLLHVHKDLTDQLNIVEVANEFISVNSD